MTRVGWLADTHDPPGGAELTQAEFRAAAPEGVEIVDCPPGGVVGDVDIHVVHNCMSYTTAELPRQGRRVIRYCHDVRDPRVQGQMIFCSPLQRERMGLDGPLIPPPVSLDSFRPTRQQRRNIKREGACCVGAFMNPGKGGHRIQEWSEATGVVVDFWGSGPYKPTGPNIHDHGSATQDELPGILSRFETFVFLPDALEPFGRCVVEAWAAGAEVITNSLVGARYWIEQQPGKLETAAESFWSVVMA